MAPAIMEISPAEIQNREQSGGGKEYLQLSDIHIRQRNNGVYHLYGGLRALPAKQAVGGENVHGGTKNPCRAPLRRLYAMVYTPRTSSTAPSDAVTVRLSVMR